MSKIETEDQVKERLELQDHCSGIGRVLGECIPENTVFAFMLADSDEGSTAYISNANREDMVQLLRDTADKIEGTNN